MEGQFANHNKKSIYKSFSRLPQVTRLMQAKAKPRKLKLKAKPGKLKKDHKATPINISNALFAWRSFWGNDHTRKAAILLGKGVNGSSEWELFMDEITAIGSDMKG